MSTDGVLGYACLTTQVLHFVSNSSIRFTMMPDSIYTGHRWSLFRLRRRLCSFLRMAHNNFWVQWMVKHVSFVCLKLAHFRLNQNVAWCFLWHEHPVVQKQCLLRLKVWRHFPIICLCHGFWWYWAMIFQPMIRRFGSQRSRFWWFCALLLMEVSLSRPLSLFDKC